MKTLGLLFMIIILSSCTRKSADVSKVTIHFPEQNVSTRSIPLKKNIVKQNSNSSIWGLETPVSVGAADCFGVYARVPENAASTCVDASGTAVLQVTKLAGMGKAGSNIELELPAGKGRILGVFAFKSSDGTCAGLMDASMNTGNFSTPLSVGQITSDLTAGTMEIKLPLSMVNAKAIEKCVGEPLNSWPTQSACSPTIAKMTSQGGGELKFDGKCLSAATAVEILDSSTNTKYPLSIAAKSDSSLTAKLLNSLTMTAGTVYKLIVTTASAQTTTPISLQLGSSLSLKSGGVKIGNFITTQSMGSAQALLLSGTDDSPLLYMAKAYNDTSGAGIIAGKYYLYNSIHLTTPLFQNLTLSDFLNANLIGTAIYPATIKFTGSNCSGDMLLTTSAGVNVVKGKYFVLPSGCSGGTPNNCSGHTLKKITASGTYQASVAYQSQIYFDTYGYGSDDIIVCQPNSNSENGVVIPAANIVNTDASDAPQIIQNSVLSQ